MSLRVWWLAFIGGLAVLVLIAISIARMYAPARPAASDAPVASSPETPKETAHITATLFFGAPDGQSLAPMRRDVALAEGVVDQGRQILAAQLSEVPTAPFVSVIPAGTMLRAFYVTERGDAFVDLSADVVRGHPGGSQNELLTVYAIVNAVSANLPAVRRVQILVDGKEADTIAGHVDLRRPLTRNDSLVRETDEK
jgi:spore germination protein GerM